MKTYICTCGTSIATKRGISLDRFLNVPISSWKEWTDDIEAVRDQVCEKLSRISLTKELDETSAEIKSLVKMGLDKDDKVILIASDTLDGKMCADIVSYFLIERELCSDGFVQVKAVKGLQSTDGMRFQKEGLKNLLKSLLEFEYQNIIFNPTGGYKSIVPYVALMGMLFNKPVKYIHEDSDDVITLTGIPVILDDDLILRVENKLRKIEQETAISSKEWQDGINYNDHRFDSLIEQIDDHVTMSGIGLLFWEKFKQDFPEELVRDERPSSKKENKLLRQGVEHHGVKRLIPIANRLLQSLFVKGVPNSCDNQPKSKVWLKALTGSEAKTHLQRASDGFCIVTDVNSDAGYSFLIETTARDYLENLEIADILNRRYFR